MDRAWKPSHFNLLTQDGGPGQDWQRAEELSVLQTRNQAGADSKGSGGLLGGATWRAMSGDGGGSEGGPPSLDPTSGIPSLGLQEDNSIVVPHVPALAWRTTSSTPGNAPLPAGAKEAVSTPGSAQMPAGVRQVVVMGGVGASDVHSREQPHHHSHTVLHSQEQPHHHSHTGLHSHTTEDNQAGWVRTGGGGHTGGGGTNGEQEATKFRKSKVMFPTAKAPQPPLRVGPLHSSGAFAEYSHHAQAMLGAGLRSGKCMVALWH